MLKLYDGQRPAGPAAADRLYCRPNVSERKVERSKRGRRDPLRRGEAKKKLCVE